MSGPTRTALAARDGRRERWRGTFVRMGTKSGWHRPEPMVLLRDITAVDGTIVADHLWFNHTKAFAAFRLHPGDVLEFDARVGSYERGYQGYREDVADEHPVSTDFHLTRPTRMVRVARGQSRQRQHEPHDADDWRSDRGS